MFHPKMKSNGIYSTGASIVLWTITQLTKLNRGGQGSQYRGKGAGGDVAHFTLCAENRNINIPLVSPTPLRQNPDYISSSTHSWLAPSKSSWTWCLQWSWVWSCCVPHESGSSDTPCRMYRHTECCGSPPEPHTHIHTIRVLIHSLKV